MAVRSSESVIFMSKEGLLRATQVVDPENGHVVMTELSLPEESNSQEYAGEADSVHPEAQRVMALVALELAETERVLRQ